MAAPLPWFSSWKWSVIWSGHVVLRAVVDDDELPGHPVGQFGPHDAVYGLADEIALVVSGDQDAEGVFSHRLNLSTYVSGSGIT